MLIDWSQFQWEEGKQYCYNAMYVSAYDGDTVTLLIEADVGFDITTSVKHTFRLYGINTPEVRGSEREAGLVSRDFVRSNLALASSIKVQTSKDKTGKYGRYLAVLWIDDVLLNQELVKQDLAVEVIY